MSPRLWWLQALSLVASLVVVVYALTFRHPVIFFCGAITLWYAVKGE